jgi:hypothetical protein
MMMEAVRTSETSVDNHSTRQYNPEDSSEHHPQQILTVGIIYIHTGDMLLPVQFLKDRTYV